MARVKRGVTAHARHKKVLKKAKGFYGRRKNTIRTAKAAVDRSMQYATRDRRVKKRNFRSLWVQRINAAARDNGLTYGRLIDGLSKALPFAAVPVGAALAAVQIALVAARADSELVLSVERRETDGNWRVVGFERSQTPLVAWPAGADKAE